ncbi:hypothetical protein JOE21_001880 [Desmospora profundinema]|uniref:Uncharacterized protein n=1 Tax=Desmospora profundinema TaxID=1571184 RepID=A0ABU1IM62_9BACL|nr:hypothetical protein [Desmospora profundinema]
MAGLPERDKLSSYQVISFVLGLTMLRGRSGMGSVFAPCVAESTPPEPIPSLQENTINIKNRALGSLVILYSGEKTATDPGFYATDCSDMS